MNRQKELTELLIDYLTDWTDNEENCWTVEESIEELKLYGPAFEHPDDILVKSSLRHFINVINPWNENAIPEVLEGIGFSDAEIELYWEQLHVD